MPVLGFICATCGRPTMQARLDDAGGKAALPEQEVQAMTDELYRADQGLEEAEVRSSCRLCF